MFIIKFRDGNVIIEASPKINIINPEPHRKPYMKAPNL